MEPDRFQQNHKDYIIGIICLIISLSLFAFGAYLIPYLLLNWQYSMPAFVINFIEMMQTNYNLTLTEASWVIFLSFFIPAILFAVIADISSNRIDNQIYGIETSKRPIKRRSNETTNLVIRIVFIIVLVFISARLFQWAIAMTSP